MYYLIINELRCASACMKNIFYKPKLLNIFIDILMLVVAAFIVLELFPLTTNRPYDKYDGAFLGYTLVWMLVSYLSGRYRALKNETYIRASYRLLVVTFIVLISMWALNQYVFALSYSNFVLYAFTLNLLTIQFVFHLIYYALLYAVEYSEELSPTIERINAELKPSADISDEAYQELVATIEEHSGIKLLNCLERKVNLHSGNTYVSFSTNPYNLKSKANYIYSSIIQLEKLNNIRGINDMMAIANEKLPDNGTLICCYESKSTRKKNFMKRFPRYINYAMYTINYLYRRVIPKMFLTRRLYFDITQGKNRILSKAEVYGRLYYTGFEVLSEKKVGELNYVFARRAKQPEPVKHVNYGPLIRLKRMGKNGKVFDVYKMRTMHPYSEYLQKYIYERNHLQDGGKFKRDIRVTTLGKIMRKYWIDEVPMFLNLFKGEMKIVGVRPLSMQFYGLYTKELQQLRIRFKPGLLPPFYADMPKTLEEIEASEMKYLNECVKRGAFITDIKYFFLILKNILINKARSA